MPDDALKRLGVWRNVVGIHGRHDDAYIRRLCRISAVSPDHAKYRRAHFLTILDRPDEVRTDVLFQISPAHGKDYDAIFFPQSAPFQPIREDVGPAFIVDPGG